ncbi:MAG: hypothetical protein H6671_00350 [Anaerolineaceae bacterium]|nr:hypothetical protein [Anaerolineaceae bacterium]
MRLALLITHIRAEEKLLISAFQNAGIEPDIILDRDLNIDLTSGPASSLHPARPGAITTWCSNAVSAHHAGCTCWRSWNAGGTDSQQLRDGCGLRR